MANLSVQSFLNMRSIGECWTEDKVKIKGWLTENITNLYMNVMMNIKDTALCRSYIDTLVNNIYDNISQVGYDEGYDSAQCDNEGEGL